MLVDVTPRFAQADAARRPVQQLDLQRRFQPRDRLADAGFGGAHLARCFRKAAGIGDPHEGPDIRKITWR
jgi:hypothetical protein